GSGTASRDGMHGSVWRATANCGVRHSGRLQLQPGRVNTISGSGFYFCGAGGGNSFDMAGAAFHGVYADGDEQGHRWGAARGAGGTAGYGGDVSSSNGTDFH